MSLQKETGIFNQLMRAIRTVFSQGAGYSVFVCLLMSVPTMIIADVVIELKDGQRITVPVDRNDVKNIVFTDKHLGKSLATPDEANTPARVVAGPGRSAYNVHRVGPQRAIKYPSEAASKAKDGDIIEIDAGIYNNDNTIWRQKNLTIRGVGGMAHLHSSRLIPNGKAIWIVQGENIVIENVEFSGAMVKDTIGAGIRLEGGDLTLRNTFFHDNEFSILAGRLPDTSLEIDSSRFWFQKRRNTYSHGMYIGALKRFTLTGSHVKGTDQGHQVKSRALENHILYNRIEDTPGGNSSRLLDLSNCGLSFVIGNDLHQGAGTENSEAIGYGPEKCAQRSDEQMKLYVVNNTFVNEADNSILVNNHVGGDVLVSNNLVLGVGKFLAGSGTQVNNVRLGLSKRQSGSWVPPPGSVAIDGAAKLVPVEGVSLVPTREFSPPAGTAVRPQFGRLDIGSREWNPKAEQLLLEN